MQQVYLCRRLLFAGCCLQAAAVAATSTYPVIDLLMLSEVVAHSVYHLVVSTRCRTDSADVIRHRPKLNYTDTGYRHVVQHHQRRSSQHYSATNLPHRNARAQHLNISRCWDVTIFCPLAVNLLYNKLQNCCELVCWWCPQPPVRVMEFDTQRKFIL